MSNPRFDPRKELNNLRDIVGRAIEQGVRTIQDITTGSHHDVRMDAYVTDDAVVIKTAPIDGLLPNSIEVSMDGNVLTIGGQTEPPEQPTDVTYLLQERKYGHFARKLEVNLPVNPSEARASLKKNGALTVTLPLNRGAFHDIEVTPTD